MSYKCEILADSISEQGHRLTTFKLTYPRIIHAEMLRHRMLSRNVASSRAIPFEKMVKNVEEDPFIPISWQKNHKGMQGNEYISDPDDIKDCIELWNDAKIYAVKIAKELNGVDKNPYVGGNSEHLNITKQLCNRLLEPFAWTTELVSGTEWENFFELRCPQYHLENVPTVNKDLSLNAKTITIVGRSKKELLKQINEIDNDSYIGFKAILNKYSDLDWLKINKSQAEIHIQKIAEMMYDAYNESTPKQLKEGEWHIPFGDRIQLTYTDYDFNGIITNEGINKKLKIATARAARISYTTLGDNPKIDYEADIKLHDRLLADNHMSPFEHCARAMSEEEYCTFIKGKSNANWDTDLVTDNTYEISAQFDHNVLGWCNNYRGFIQYRYLVENQ